MWGFVSGGDVAVGITTKTDQYRAWEESLDRE